MQIGAPWLASKTAPSPIELANGATPAPIVGVTTVVTTPSGASVTVPVIKKSKPHWPLYVGALLVFMLTRKRRR